MNKYIYPKIGEVLYHEKLDNGLNVYIVPKEGFSKVYSTFVTKFGAATNKFVPYGEQEFITVPLGVAHFLEHKMFEMEDGTDAINLFENIGAEANAFTDYYQTAYLATSISSHEEVINLLLDYVQSPHFNDENVTREQGIIEQELMMYMDKPSSRLYLGLMKNLYCENAVREDIVGTVKSIKSINKEVLYTCYNTFYHPSNMYLMIVGDVNPEEMIKLVKDNQSKKNFKKPLDIRKQYVIEDNKVYKKTSKIYMDILMPKVSVGLKLPFKKYEKNELMISEMLLRILLENSFGVSSDTYQYLLDSQLVNTGYSYYLQMDELSGFIKIDANTNKVNEFIEYITKKLINLGTHKISEEDFQRMKKAMIGSFIKSYNNLEFIANGYIDFLFKSGDLFEFFDLFEQVTVSDIEKFKDWFVERAISNFIIYPNSFKNNK